MTRYLLDVMPIPLAYCFVVILILVSSEFGFLIGRHFHRGGEDAGAPASVGPMVGGLMGMLAFVLAFTFSIAASQYDDRREDVLLEANAIGTAYLRADLLDSEFAVPIRDLLREYVEVRLAAARPQADLPAALRRSLEIQGLFWTHVAAGARASESGIATLVVTSANEVIDMHEKRYTDAVRVRIPQSIWFGLIAIVVLTMGALGLQVGLSGKRRMAAIIPVALAFAVLTTLVIDLNRPQGGAITIGQEAMTDLLDQMQPSQ